MSSLFLLYISTTCPVLSYVSVKCSQMTLPTDHMTDTSRLSTKPQCGIDRIVTWSELNHMALNAQKTKCMYVSTRQKRQILSASFQSLLIGRQTTDEIHSHKVLGAITDRDLSWSNHISFL